MKNLKKGLAKYAADMALIAGAVIVSVGVGMIYLPAGIIAAGTLMISGAVLACMSGGGEE